MQPAAITPIYYWDLVKAFFKKKEANIKFEKKIAFFFKKKYCLTFTSLMRTTYATFLPLKEIDARRKVILPRYSCPSFAHGILANELKIEYCDIDPETLSIDIQNLLSKDLNNTLAIVCTNLFGLSSDIVKIKKICEKFNIYLIEGVDYGIGTEFNGLKIGTLGDIAILNFQEGKALPVGGGAIITNLDFINNFYSKKRLMCHSNYIKIIGYYIFSRPFMYSILYKFINFFKINKSKLSMEDTLKNTSNEIDFTFNPKRFDLKISNFQCALGLVILGRLNKEMKRRLSNYKKIESILIYNNIFYIKKLPSLNKVHFIRVPILIKNNRSDIMNRLLKAGIEASPMYVEYGMHINKKLFPGAYRVSRELLTLPCHPFMRDKDFKKIDNAFSSFLSK
jgi:perosamine synthetase